MKISITTYSFHQLVNEDRLGMRGVMEKIKEFGADAIEYSLPDRPHDEYIEFAKKCKALTEEVGIESAAFVVGADFIRGSGGDLKAEIKRVQGLVDVAEAFGVKVMRHDTSGGFPPEVKSKRGFDDALPRLIEGSREVTKYAEQKGIVTCTENHGFFAQDAERVEKIINGVGEDNFGSLVDFGNFLCADGDPAKSVGLLAQYARHAHAKDFYYKPGYMDDPGAMWFQTRNGNYLKGAVIGHGVVPIRQCLRLLKKNGYDGYVTVEYEGHEDTLLGIKTGVDNLKRYMG